MCYEFELEYQLRRAEEARKDLAKKPPAETPKPEEAPHPSGQEDPVPV